MSITTIGQQSPAANSNGDRDTPPHRMTFPTSAALVGFALLLGILTFLPMASRSFRFRSENALLILAISIFAAWRCPPRIVLILALIFGVASSWIDLSQGSDWFNCVIGHSVQIGVSVLFIVWTSRAKRLLEQARRCARVDGLTGLPNRQAILEALDVELCRVRRFGRSFSIAMLDCDGFKAINDQQGHLVGDHVLQSIAAALRKSTRAYDCIGRLGGDEFVLILSEADLDEIPTIIERLRASLRLELIREYPSLTFSIGVVTIQFQSDDEGWLLDHFDCLRRADEAMYAAKRSGRDQTRFEMIRRGV